jgi:serine/threonine protein kinase
VDKRSQGGEGDLWRGVLPLDSVELSVAVKVIHPANAARLDEWRQRWQRQAELLRSCDHPGLVKVRDVFEGLVPHSPGVRTGGRSLYLVMNWVEGPSIEQWITLAPDRSTEEVLDVAEKVASAVDHLHSGAVAGVGVLHRDIKPANVVLGSNGPCLVDFGFARLDTEEEMTMVGTPSYLAPEVVTGGRYAPATDRYAFGATIFFALTGQRPNVTAPSAMRARLGAVDGFNANPGAIEAVLAMLASEPARRPDSCEGWIDEVRRRVGLKPPRRSPIPAMVDGPRPVRPGEM